MKKINKEKFQSILFQSIGIIFIFLVIEIIALSINDSLIFPGIEKIFIGFLTILSDKASYFAFFESFERTLIALLFSFILAFILGLFSGLFNKFYLFLKPVVGLLKLVPTPCVIFVLFVLSRGEANITSIVITLLVVFPIIYESFVNGIYAIDSSIIKSLKIEGFYSFKSIFKVIIPESYPYILLGVLNSCALGVKVSIISEILVGSDSIWGLGRLIYTYKINAQFDLMISMTFLIIIFFIFIDFLIYLIKKLIKI